MRDAMELFRDVRLTFRDLLRQPGYTTAAVVTLSLAIGANSAIFSAVYAVLLKPSAIFQPGNLVICWERDPLGGPVIEVSYRNFQDWVVHSRSFSQAAAVGSSTWPAILDAGGGQPHTVVGVMPEGFDFPRGTDVWLPVVPILANAGGGRVQLPLESVGVLFVLGR